MDEEREVKKHEREREREEEARVATLGATLFIGAAARCHVGRSTFARPQLTLLSLFLPLLHPVAFSSSSLFSIVSHDADIIVKPRLIPFASVSSPNFPVIYAAGGRVTKSSRREREGERERERERGRFLIVNPRLSNRQNGNSSSSSAGCLEHN